ncbi:hypothetical protein LOTGIDRAFT_153129 [Lottia gigantea]|uniref:Sushi domain-containing protein n=1 Tax=Lottia gigantea TaxID=225164 RepID=V4AA82_LOTGI|nr:hypothetical protein LOTGIDRAFT_153129 [Lottia gigantea]ESO93677.1 hypothetical protein LOTGIDRAFT_153129 [Lottia gigantea]
MRCECAIGLLVFQFMLYKADELDLLFAENENYADNANYEDFEFDFEDYDYDFLNVKKTTCKNPGPIKHGKVEIWGDDLLIDYTCDDGFIPHGITHGACDVKNKAWTIDPVVCISSDCNFLLPPRKGIVTMDKNQGVASITCEQGLHLIGSPVLYCQQGKWVGDFPVCARDNVCIDRHPYNLVC